MEILRLVIRQLVLVSPFWALGILVGAILSVYAANTIRSLVTKLGFEKHSFFVSLLAAFLGAASPVCMYGTVPLIAFLGKKGLPQHLLVIFMISSILINPNLFIFSFALGVPAAMIRLLNSVFAGMIAGFLVKKFYKKGQIFQFQGFDGTLTGNDFTAQYKKVIRNIWRTFQITGPYVFAGILISALYQQYFPQGLIMRLFGGDNGFGVLLAATIGVPVYVCGGGTIPLIRAWMYAGMSLGSVAAFMVTGPATKLNNLSAVKNILGIRNFMLYLIFTICYGVTSGFAIDFFLHFFQRL